MIWTSGEAGEAMGGTSEARRDRDRDLLPGRDRGTTIERREGGRD